LARFAAEDGIKINSTRVANRKAKKYDLAAFPGAVEKEPRASDIPLEAFFVLCVTIS
jgi:hypothetical protein